ncbi:hypothetical protein [Lentilactobacillus parabuchneri]|uniref:Uncharacterized protein n=1 Tax=Lentilactobacillus parabuchneri TaxID=152331 RepID=A0A844EEG8_9LACO|nr:hypothetical protein [Lentilactobacillus parabuchneri]
MSKYNDTLLTNAGVDLASRAAHGDASFKIIRVESTADDLSSKTEDELKAMTAIPNKVQDGSIVGQEDTAPAIQGIRLQFLNTGLTKSYSIQAMGIYAKEDGQEQEILYAITTAEKEHPQYMPDFADKVTLRFGMTIRVVVGDKANVVIVFDPDGLATIKFVQDAIASVKIDDTDFAKLSKDNTFKGINKFEKAPTNSVGVEYVLKDYVDKLVADATQAAIDQSKENTLTEFTKRNVPNPFWTGTQAEFDVLKSAGKLNPDGDYRIVEADS